ncbi:hypothetical protein PCANC_09928 [Puccinia coronata f. sp. avenae]|uniref:Uncharacterized protein n=1 Tax=Puccinia coronata f. sp. avenae TaxID=200324 RepID=A0A2N5SMB8_9BASI|nr:hypothetical protein PCANC_17459 [Puccinia coronata f. sp. avenae]PLW44324.1 hypothetical protein PCANC_09928 [Puccinia coronata f. sp. avenae]
MGPLEADCARQADEVPQHAAANCGTSQHPRSDRWVGSDFPLLPSASHGFNFDGHIRARSILDVSRIPHHCT